MSDWNDSGVDPYAQAMLDWAYDQSKTAAGKQQYGASQLTNLNKLLTMANNPLLGVLSGGYDPMTYVPQYADQGGQVPFGATDAEAQQYRSRYGSDQRLNDIFDQMDQGADQLTINKVIDGSADYWAQQGLTPDDVKGIVGGYGNVKADQALAQQKYQYGGAGGTGASSGSGGGATGANGYGPDGLPSKSNYFGIDPTLGNQLEEYVPPEVQAVQQKALQDYMARAQHHADQQAHEAANFDAETNRLTGIAQGRGDAALGKFLSDLNAPRPVDDQAVAAAGIPGAAGAVRGQQYVDNYGITAHDPSEAAQEMVDPNEFARALGTVNARPTGGFNGYDVEGAQVHGRTSGGKKESLRDLFDTFSPVGRQAGTVKAQRTGERNQRYRQNRDQIMQNYAANAAKQDAWTNKMAQQFTHYQPTSNLQHNLYSRLAMLLSTGA